MKKIVLVFFVFTFLTGCIQGSVMLGSAISVASTGGIQQVIISQGINHGIKKKSGKSISEHAYSSLNEEVRNCETIHSDTLNQIFFETLDEIDCEVSQ
tara:strand:- start:682 stop:975 length:294 start_codon:yes stop_codon:yes gene_type:complete